MLTPPTPVTGWSPTIASVFLSLSEAVTPTPRQDPGTTTPPQPWNLTTLFSQGPSRSQKTLTRTWRPGQASRSQASSHRGFCSPPRKAIHSLGAPGVGAVPEEHLGPSGQWREIMIAHYYHLQHISPLLGLCPVR